MERSEPTLVPEWLKNAGNLNGGGSISHSDDQAAGKLARNKSLVNSNGPDFRRSFSSDRTTSSYFRRSSSGNGSTNPSPYSNFGRNRHDRDWDRDKYDSRDRNKLGLGDRRQRNFSDPPENTLSIKFDRDALRRSQSMISGKRADTWPKKAVNESGNSKNGLTAKGSPVGGGVNKTSFERDFPSLGAEQRTITSGLSSAIQSLPVGSSSMIGGEKWTSALAEVPVLPGSNGNGISSSSQQAFPLSSLNMAEAVAQGPSRAQATPQLSVGIPTLEERAIKQSRQLIPVTPSMPKTLVLNSSDKQRTKVGPNQHPVTSSPLAVNHSPRGGPAKADVSKAPSNMGKLQVLKPAREKNGVTPLVTKDNSSPAVTTNATSLSVSATTNRAPPNNPKPILTVLEKRPTSQARSRNDFFNSVRNKSVGAANSSSVSPPSSSDKLAEIGIVPDTSRAGGAHLSDEQDCVSNGKKHPIISDPVIIPEEEEAVLLRSMGWEENSDEGALTEEEINAFIQHINSKPFLKIQPKFLLPFGSQMAAISSGLSSSDANLGS